MVVVVVVVVVAEEEEGDDDLEKGFSQCIAPASLGFMTYPTYTLYQVQNYSTARYSPLIPPA